MSNYVWLIWPGVWLLVTYVIGMAVNRQDHSVFWWGMAGWGGVPVTFMLLTRFT